ncbi:MAG TPA: glycerol-3-phosphate 1-O-acyltransferase [Micavibrio sp.]|nr:glycerol-3-phosphate 1-O-acyltransferase PlsY [Micavibrio sp.]HIL28251.1 glycerol-3-phosphate 1-O-acyltransferase [Micavibrio sp.]
MMFLLAILLGYLFGSIPFGLVLSYMAGYGDIRKIGSGNIGATNVLRTGNKPLAFVTLMLDSGKGAIAALTAMYLINDQAAIFAGLAAIIGHMFPVWLKFKGGKGVATTLGTLLAAVPTVGVFACLTWLVMALIFRISSLSALVAVALSPIAAHFIYGDAQVSGVCGIIALLVWVKHRANIQRLIKGEEPKIGKKKDK